VTPEAWATVGLVVAPLMTVLVLWLRKRLQLIEPPISDEAATAVKISTKSETKPDDRNQALILLAGKLAQQDAEIQELKARDNAWAMFTWELEHWGLRGWARSPKPHEPMPTRPPRLRPDADEYEPRRLIDSGPND